MHETIDMGNRETTTITVDEDVWEYLHRKKKRGDSFNDVVRRELGLDETAEDRHGQEDETVDDISDAVAAAVEAEED